ncbi:hypothetical protein BH09VER1_BH09VER1_48820 [soil metagenome]
MTSPTYTEQILTGSYVQSLVWAGDDLVDWVNGGVRYRLDGSVSDRTRGYSYCFDAAVSEPSGEYSVIYTKLGTKALVLQNGEIVRELNRSFYHAYTYEYPITLLRRGDQILAIHCPEEYNKLEIQDVVTGELLTQRTSESGDFFHSRLAVSPGGRFLLSAGWCWHPWDAVVYYDLEAALKDPSHLDSVRWGVPPEGKPGCAEESTACWLREGEVLLGASTEPETEEEARDPEVNRLKPSGLARYNIIDQTVRGVGVLDEPAGTLMPVGATHAMAFYKYPRLIRLSDGHVEFSLPAISSGTQISSIVSKDHLPPPLALDSAHHRFAIAQGNKIHVISIVLPTN